MTAIQLWPVFICYRRVDGSVAARRLYELLDQWRTDGPKGQPIQIDAYLDETMPGVADWKALHRPYLEKARALIVVCTPGAWINDGPADWVHMEIDWWRKHRETAPILVDPLLEGLRYVPKQIARDWPDIQRIPLVEREWKALSGAELEEKTIALRRQIIGAVLPSGAAIYAQELEAERQRSRRLKSALLVAAALLLAVALVALYANYQQATARRSERIATALSLDSRAASFFNEANALDARRELERARFGDLTERAALVASSVSVEEALEVVSVLRENLGNELAQVKTDIASLEQRSGEALTEGRKALREADTAWQALAAEGIAVAERRRRAEPPHIFTVEILNAGAGESILLHYGTPDDLKLVMINAGPRRQFHEIVAARLRELSAQRFDGRPVPIELFVVGDRDADKTDGLLAMLRSLAGEERAVDPMVELRGIWANIFRVTGERENLRARIRRLIDQLRIPLNEPFGRYIVRPDRGRLGVTLPGGLQVVVLGPAYERVKALHQLTEREARDIDGTVEPLMPVDFAGTKIDSSPAPLTVAGTAAGAPTSCRASENASQRAGGAYRDSSVPNLASTILLFTYQGRTFLFTGDARGDLILDGLSGAGLMNAQGVATVDLMTIPHLGSDNNVTVDFFRRVRASGYLFSGDGTHGNPEVTTVAALVAARGCDAYRMYFVNREGRNNPPGIRNEDERADPGATHGAALDRFFREEDAFSPNYRRVFRSMRDGTVRIDLLTPVRF